MPRVYFAFKPPFSLQGTIVPIRFTQTLYTKNDGRIKLTSVVKLLPLLAFLVSEGRLYFIRTNFNCAEIRLTIDII